jgi:hypothetical protein
MRGSEATELPIAVGARERARLSMDVWLSGANRCDK